MRYLYVRKIKDCTMTNYPHLERGSLPILHIKGSQLVISGMIQPVETVV